MSEFVIVIAQGCTFLYQLNGTKAERVAASPTGEDIDLWLTQHLPERADCSLITDVMDESYVQTTLPALWVPATRQQLLQRRLSQQLRETPYRAAVLTPSGSWQPPTRAIFVGMGQTERISECVALLSDRHARIKGLWPLSALIAAAANKKRFKPKSSTRDKLKAPPRLPLTLALIATPTGLRQVLASGQTPLFSRLAVGSNESSLLAENVLNEARRTVQYLIAQQWITVTDLPIATRLWLPAENEGALVDAANDTALDVQALTTIDDAYLLLLPLIKYALPGLQLLPAANRLAWRAAQIGRAAMAVGASALVIAALWSAELAWEAWSKNKLKGQQLAQAAAITQQARQEVLQAKGDLSQAGLAVAAVQAWKKAVEAQPDQTAAMKHLAGSLQAVPGLTLEKMRWELPGSEPETPGAAPVTMKCVQSSSAASQPASTLPITAAGTAAAAAETTPTVPKSPAAMLNLTASLDDSLSQREALLLQSKIIARLSTGGWAANMTRSTIEFDAAQRQTGIVGKAGARTVELCMERAAK